MIVADTNVVSEFMKDTPDQAVMAWAQGLGSGDLTITVVTIEEIEGGLGRLPAGRRRRSLQARWQQLVEAFADAVLIYGVPEAQQTAQILVARGAQGRHMSLADAQMAGICVSAGCELATRNVRDFADVSDLVLINPFP